MDLTDRVNMIHYMVYLHNQTINNGYVRVVIGAELLEKKK